MLPELIGVWKYKDPDFQAITEISESISGGPDIVVWYPPDGELFVVANIQDRKGCLSFDVFVPSTKYRTKHGIKLISKNRLEEQLTVFEEWIPYENGAETFIGNKLLINKSAIQGEWETKDQDSETIINVRKEKKYLEVSAYNKNTGEKFLINEVKARGKYITFTSYVPSVKCTNAHKIYMKEKGVLVHEITFFEVLIRCSHSKFRRVNRVV